MKNDEAKYLLDILKQLKAKEAEQSEVGIFDDRLLTKIEQVKALLMERPIA